MGANFVIKQHDTKPDLLAALSDLNGPTDLASVQAVTLVLDDGRRLPCTTTATVGQVRHVWQVGETAKPGDFRGEFEVVFYDGSVQTFPGGSYLSLSVLADIS